MKTSVDTAVSQGQQCILFLADRNILVDQTKTADFKHFGDKMIKIDEFISRNITKTSWPRFGNRGGSWLINGRIDGNLLAKIHQMPLRNFFIIIYSDKRHMIIK